MNALDSQSVADAPALAAEIERLKAEVARLSADLAEHERFPDINPGPLFRMDRDAIVILANIAARTVFGDSLVGCCWRDVCPGMTMDLWKRILSTDEIIRLETRVGELEFVFQHRNDAHSGLIFCFGSDVTMQRQAERTLRQSEKMATLGTLAAGIAHELNNPAAATRRAADQLREAFARLETAQTLRDKANFSDGERTLLKNLAERAAEAARHPGDLDAMTRADREAEVEDWLEAHGFAEPWEMAPALVSAGFERPALEDVARQLGSDALTAAIAWIGAALPVYALAYEIGNGSARISEIVGALKSYSYLGQAPVQEIDLREGLDNTLIILRSKLKQGIDVRRDYGADVPRVLAHGSELNQVWTNLLDNAADALGGKGHITIRTRLQDPWAVVEIEDDGPGIPDEVQPKIFDPFFTTKEPGKGTGLGLATTYSIIRNKHHGEIGFQSRPGRTVFTVKLPLERATSEMG